MRCRRSPAAGAQLALLGSGDKPLESRFARGRRAPSAARRRVIIGYDESLAHLVQGGADALLVPSRFEPCGLTQLCALRYGAIPDRRARRRPRRHDHRRQRDGAGGGRRHRHPVRAGDARQPRARDRARRRAAARSRAVAAHAAARDGDRRRLDAARETVRRAVSRARRAPRGLTHARRPRQPRAARRDARAGRRQRRRRLRARERRSSSAASTRSGRNELERIALPRAHRRRVPRLRRRHRRRRALRTARARPVRPARGPSLQSREAARRSVRASARPARSRSIPRWSAAATTRHRATTSTARRSCPRASSRTAPRSRALDRPRVPWATRSSTSCTCAASRGRIPDVPEALRGTFAGLAHPAAIAHLTRLGVTTVELMPIAAWIDERHLGASRARPTTGATTRSRRSSPIRGSLPAASTRSARAVAALHAAGIEVILDVVLNHTGEGDALGPTVSLRGLDNATYYRTVRRRSRALRRRHRLRQHAGARPAAGAAPRAGRASLLCGDHGRRRLSLRSRHDARPPRRRLRSRGAAAAGDRAGSRAARVEAHRRALGRGTGRLSARRVSRRHGASGTIAIATRCAGSGAATPAASASSRRASRARPTSSPRARDRRRARSTSSPRTTASRSPTSWRTRRSTTRRTARTTATAATRTTRGTTASKGRPTIRRSSPRASATSATCSPRSSCRAARRCSRWATSSAARSAATTTRYAQDNALTWLDWSAADDALVAFVARARRRCASVTPRCARIAGSKAPPASRGGLPDVEWRRPDGRPMDGADWTNPEVRVARRRAPSARRRCRIARTASPSRSTPGTIRSRCAGPSRATASPGACASTPSLPTRTARRQRSGRRRDGTTRSRRVRWSSSAEEPDRCAARAEAQGVEPRGPRRSSPRPRASPRIGGMSPASGTSSAPTRSARCSRRWAFRPIRPSDARAHLAAIAAATAAQRSERRGSELRRRRSAAARPSAASCRPSFAPARDASASPRISMRCGATAIRASAISRRSPRSAAATARAGGSIVGINPLHALFPEDRERASPYHPSDRRFLDPIYIDVERVPDLAASNDARALLAQSGRAIAALAASADVDYGAVWAVEGARAGGLLRRLRASAPRAIRCGVEFERFVAAGGEPLRRFALFEAIAAEHPRVPWQAWPHALREPDAPASARFARPARASHPLRAVPAMARGPPVRRRGPRRARERPRVRILPRSRRRRRAGWRRGVGESVGASRAA